MGRSFVDLAILLPGDLFNAGSNPCAGQFDHFQALACFDDVTLDHLNNSQGIANMVIEIPDFFETPTKASISSGEHCPDQYTKERSLNRILDGPLYVIPRR